MLSGSLSNLFPDWWSQASCRSIDDSIFFGAGTSPSNLSRARVMCSSCPSMKDCLSHALTQPEDYGVWAGTSVLDRGNMRGLLAEGMELEEIHRLHVEADLRWGTNG